jgi:hypothetical protein
MDTYLYGNLTLKEGTTKEVLDGIKEMFGEIGLALKQMPGDATEDFYFDGATEDSSDVVEVELKDLLLNYAKAIESFDFHAYALADADIEACFESEDLEKIANGAEVSFPIDCWELISEGDQ